MSALTDILARKNDDNVRWPHISECMEILSVVVRLGMESTGLRK